MKNRSLRMLAFIFFHFLSFFQICEMLVNPQARSGQIPGSNGAPYVVLGDQWIGYDDVNYVTRKVRYSFQDIRTNNISAVLV